MPFQLPIRRGDAHPLAKLSNAERNTVRDAVRKATRSISDLARCHHVSRDTIRRIGRQPADWLAGAPPDGIE